MFLTAENERIDQTGILNQDLRNFWKDDNRRAYNSATLGGKGRIGLTPKASTGNRKSACGAQGEEQTCDFPLTCFRPLMPSSWEAYVDDANPSASERQAARAV
jgi:hypothetical protein